MIEHTVKQAIWLVSVKAKAIQAFTELADLAYANAKEKGFHDDAEDIEDLIYQESISDDFVGMITWFESTTTQAAIARMHSELSEALEAVRNGNPTSEKLGPEFTELEEELADVVIRIMDLAGRDKLKLGEAVIAKMLYNSKRPHKHGKNS